MGLSWQQGPLGQSPVGTFLTSERLPERLLYAEPLRRRMHVVFGGGTIAVSDDVILLHEPARYPVAYFPKADVQEGVLTPTGRVTQHPELGDTTWLAVTLKEHGVARAAWQHTDPPAFARLLRDRVAFAWHAMDGFYEEDERIVGHAADPYHRIDIRQSSRELVVHHGDSQVAATTRALVLYESGFAPRWYVPREDVNFDLLTSATRQTFCPYKGLCRYWDIGASHQVAWGYPEPYPEVQRIAGYVSFEADELTVTLDGERQHVAPGQQVIPHGPDRGLTPDEVRNRPAPGSIGSPLGRSTPAEPSSTT
jgi:uncharacterized protein (DUF427 family)